MNVTINGTPIRLEHISGRVRSEKHITSSDLGEDTPEVKSKSKGKAARGMLTEFWLAGDDGKEHCFTLSGRLPLQTGQYISLIQAYGKAQSMLVAVANHSSQKISFIGSPAYALRWLGVSKSNSTMGMVVYAVCALLALLLWLVTEGNLMVVLVITVVAGIGSQYMIGNRDATHKYQSEIEFKKGIMTYADQVRTAVSVLGSNDADSLLDVKAQSDDTGTGDPAPAPALVPEPPQNS